MRYGLGGVWGFHKRSDNNPLGRLKHVSILRNNLYNIGDRPPPGEGCHAIEIKGGELVEIAYNVIDRTYASGIQALNNRWSGGGHGRVGHKLRSLERPLNRCLIHHNKVTNTMLQGNDWGSIASWGIGPSYVYSNISGNSLGYRHSFYREGWPKDHDFDSFFSLSNTNFGTAFYFDNMHKGYLIKNIAWGKNNPKALTMAGSKKYPLSELFNTSYNANNGSDRVYRWGYLAVRFMMENNRDKVDQSLVLSRQGEWAG